MSQLRAIIIDDDKRRREEVSSLLPDYISSIALGYGDGALDYIKPDAEGVVPDVVFLYGDDSKSLGLYTYDWMINKSGNIDIAMIPVIVLTDDEFSDRSLEFLEIGDVVFYEGEIEESRLFSVLTEAVERADFMPDPPVPVYEEVKNIDRIAGSSVKAPDGGGKQRVLVLDMDSKMANLEAALARGRQRATQIRTLIDAAQKAKGEKEERRNPREGQTRPYKSSANIFKKADVQEKPLQEKPIPADIPVDPDSVAKFREKAMTNPFGAFNAQGTIKIEDPEKRTVPKGTGSKKTVVIVDTDLKTRKLCTLFLTQNYNVVALESGMSTIDYFVRNRADLLIINPNLPGMGGVAVVDSVHNQPGCANIPVMYLVGDDYMESRTHLVRPGVVGILNKPVKREYIARAVEGLFGNNP